MNDDVIVTLRDDRSVNLYRIRGRDNLFIRSVQITSTGKIIGSPVQSGNRCIITYEEKSGNFIRVMQNSYELPQFRLINKNYLSSKVEEATPSAPHQSESYQEPIRTHSSSSGNSSWSSSDSIGCGCFFVLILLFFLYIVTGAFLESNFDIILPGLKKQTEERQESSSGAAWKEQERRSFPNKDVSWSDIEQLDVMIKRLRALKCKSAESALYQRRLLALLPLIRNGADVDVTLPETKGNTALHFACALGSWSISQWLVEHGANVNARTHRGATPMDCLGDDNAARIKKLLQKHGGHYGL